MGIVPLLLHSVNVYLFVGAGSAAFLDAQSGSKR